MDSVCKILRVILIASIIPCLNGKECESLSYRIGVEISCSHPITRESLDCRSDKVPRGTLAQFRCKKFYVPNGGLVTHGEMRCNGEWSPDKPFRSFSCKIGCGMPSPDANWPWYVGIFKRERLNAPYKFACGGTIVNPFNAGLLVITSSECVNVYDSVSNIEVHFGKFRYNNHDNSENEYKIAVSRIAVAQKESSLALIQLKHDLILSKIILPACLDGISEPTKYYLDSAEKGQLVGFGDTTNGRNYYLRNVTLELTTDFRECNYSLKSRFESSICARNTESRAICGGDFGGGLVFPRYIGKNVQYFLQGVLVNNFRTCRSNAPFIPVSEYSTWIKTTVLAFQQTEQQHQEEFERIPASSLDVQKSRPTHKENSRVPALVDVNASISSNLKDYELAGVEFHNLYRRKHGSPPVTLSPEFSKLSQEEADRSLRTNRYKFESPTNWLVLSDANLTLKALVESAVRDWYKTSANYNWMSPSPLPFTLIVWKRTTAIGIGVAQLGAKQVVVVKYNSPDVAHSEEENSFKENVMKPV